MVKFQITMRMRHSIRVLLSLLLISISLNLSIVGIASAQTIVSILPSTQQIDEGQDFTISVYVELDAPSSGAQFNLQFNSSLVNVINVTEGDLFNQDEATVIFNSGTINNSQGTVKNVYAFILGESNVTTPGIFANINLVALNNSGTCTFEMSNVIICNPYQSLPIIIVNGNVHVGDVSDIDTILPIIAITSPTDGTTVTTPTITVSGIATDDTGVTGLTVNSNPVTLESDGSFTTTVSLTSGVNTITVVATDAVGNTAAKTITITYTPAASDTTPPTITILSPASGTTATTPIITVSGTATDDTGVTGLTVNGNPVTPVSDGSFTTTVSLTSGVNTITVVATDAAGNIAIETVKVTYSASDPYLVFAITPNSRIGQIGMPVTIFLSAINAGTATATDVSISQASGLPATISYQTWDGITLTGTPDTPVDISSGETVHFVLTIDATSEFASSAMTFNVSGTNSANAPVSGVNILTMAASATPYADVIMMSTSLDVSTAVNTATAFALATTNVGTASATDVSLVVEMPTSITGLSYQVNETNLDGSIKGPATGLTIPIGGTPTFAVFLATTQAIDYDPANNRIVLKLVDGSGKVVGAQSVSVSTM